MLELSCLYNSTDLMNCKLYCHQYLGGWQATGVSSETLSQIPQSLTSVADVRRLLGLVHNYHLCYGNNDERGSWYTLHQRMGRS